MIFQFLTATSMQITVSYKLTDVSEAFAVSTMCDRPDDGNRKYIWN